MHEVGRMKDEHDKSMLRPLDLLERLDQKQRALERQLTGLTSFSRRVEKFLEQSASEGATAPIEPPKVTRYEKERPTATLVQTPGVLRQMMLIKLARRISAQYEEKSERVQFVLTSLPEQWAAGDTAILRNQDAKQVRDIGSLILETPIQRDYEAGVEVRSLLSIERQEDADGRLAVLMKTPMLLELGM